MNGIPQILSLVDAYRFAKGIKDATLSTMVFADGKRIRAIREGRDMGMRTGERAVRWFSDHWPDGVQWPPDVDRPAHRDDSRQE